jgi:hypothetical protein
LFGQSISVGRGTLPSAALSPGGQEFANLDGTIDPAQAPALQVAGSYAALHGYNLFDFGVFDIKQGTAPVDARTWRFGIDGTTGAMGWNTLNDAGTAQQSVLSATRSGYVPTSLLAFFNSTSSPHQGQVVANAHAIYNAASSALTSQTPAQKLFQTSTNGAITLPIGEYEFECEFSLSAMSATSGSFGFNLLGAGTATIGSQRWLARANKAALATAVAPQESWNTAANTAIATATTNTVGWARIKGVVKITAAGTIIPSVSLGIAAAAVVGINSSFKIAPINSSATATTTGGPWS